MNPHNNQTNYMATGHAHTQSQPSQSESRVDKDYLLSVRGILKFVSLVSEYFYMRT